MDEKKIILDGTEVTEEKLNEEKKRTDVRIIEVGNNTFKTLTRLQE